MIVGNDLNLIYKNEKLRVKNFIEQINVQLSQLIKIKKKFSKLEIILFNLPFIYSDNFQINKNQEEKKNK